MKYAVLLGLLTMSCLKSAENQNSTLESGASDPQIIALLMGLHYADALVSGQTKELTKTKSEAIERFYAPGKHYRVVSPVFEAVFHAESRCLVKFISSNVPHTLDTKPDYRISEKRDVILNAIKTCGFMRFSGLARHGVEVDEAEPVFEDRGAKVFFQRTIKGIPVYEEKVHFVFPTKWESPAINMIFAIVTFGKPPEVIVPVLTSEIAAVKAKEAVESCAYARQKKISTPDSAPIVTDVGKGRLVFAHPNAALEEGRYDYKTSRDAALTLCYLFDVTSAEGIRAVFIDAVSGLAVGGERNAE